MVAKTAKLIDKSGAVLALASLTDEGSCYGGTIDLRLAPPSLRAIFSEFEEIVNDQLFSLVDEVQARIDALGIKVIFDDGHEEPIEALQVFPAIGQVSFRRAKVPSKCARPA